MYIKKKLTKTNINNNARQGTVAYKDILRSTSQEKGKYIASKRINCVIRRLFCRFPQRAIRLRLVKIRFENCYLPDCVPNNF